MEIGPWPWEPSGATHLGPGLFRPRPRGHLGIGPMCAQLPFVPMAHLGPGPVSAHGPFGPRAHSGPGPIWAQGLLGPGPVWPDPILARAQKHEAMPQLLDTVPTIMQCPHCKEMPQLSGKAPTGRAGAGPGPDPAPPLSLSQPLPWPWLSFFGLGPWALYFGVLGPGIIFDYPLLCCGPLHSHQPL